jgi:hypothetical protein
MRWGGIALALIGAVVLVLGIIRHWDTFMLKTTNHAALILSVIGLVILVGGVVLAVLDARREEHDTP